MTTPTPVVSVGPVVLADPGRGTDLQVRVSAPTTGSQLPVIVFSHGYGWSAGGYAPLVDFWASHGFVVVQPTHLDSRTLNLPPDDSRTPLIWRIRFEDLRHVIDQLDALEAAVPGLAGRVDHSRIAVAGHSWGGQSASMLLGARVLDADGQPGEDLTDPRVTAGLLLSTTGTGGTDLSPFAAEHFPFMNPSFAELTTPTLVVAGDHDQSPSPAAGRTGSPTRTCSALAPTRCSPCSEPSTHSVGSPATPSPRPRTRTPSGSPCCGSSPGPGCALRCTPTTRAGRRPARLCWTATTRWAQSTRRRRHDELRHHDRTVPSRLPRRPAGLAGG
jgi:pimeloyl-ACP methyl ester carboxylesterase